MNGREETKSINSTAGIPYTRLKIDFSFIFLIFRLHILISVVFDFQKKFSVCIDICFFRQPCTIHRPPLYAAAILRFFFANNPPAFHYIFTDKQNSKSYFLWFNEFSFPTPWKEPSFLSFTAQHTYRDIIAFASILENSTKYRTV